MGSYHAVTGQTKSLPQYISRGWGIHVNSLDCLQLKIQKIRMYSITTGRHTGAIHTLSFKISSIQKPRHTFL